MIEDNRGMTLIELVISLFISTLILSVIFLGLNPLYRALKVSTDISEYQLYTNEVFTFIHNQVIYATKVGIYTDLDDVSEDYTNSIYIDNGELKLNNKVLYRYDKDFDTQLYVESYTDSSIKVYIELSRDDNLVYKSEQVINIPYIEWAYEFIDGTDGSIISYNTDEIYGYDINTVANELRRNMYEFAVNWTLLTDAEKKEKYGVWYANNTTFRDNLRKDKYGGTWPDLPKDKNGNYPLGIDSSTPMYVQVYIHTPNNTDNSNADIVVFATRTQGNNWYTNLIYDHEELQWYQKTKGGWSCNQPWSVIKAEIHSDRWTPVKI